VIYRKDGWLSMRQMMKEQCQMLVLTLCKDWNNSTLQDQNPNKDKSWRFVVGFIAGIAKAFEALDSRSLAGKDEIYIYIIAENIQILYLMGFLATALI
jgi:hypothetical protein